MNQPNCMLPITVGIILATSGGCAASEQAQAPSGSSGAESACVWVAFPIGFKWVAPASGGLDPWIIEMSVSSSLEGVNSRCDDINGLTPLQVLAATLDDRELPIIRHVLTQGADIDLAVPPDSPWAESQARYAGATSLHFAADGSNRTAILEMLVESGGNVAVRTNAGATPLHFAAARGGLEMVELLLERGSDIHARDERGWTALHYAASDSKSEMVVIALVDIGGADIEATTNSGRKAYDLILENETLKETEAVYLLEVR
ncbi:MAG: ankyrin repeat domain-containing protein [Gammaproteobacteria bacterium]|nr:ankyrin repeat domain-containing protein [Gammaproteobacteria bacterium]MDE0414034.1 ankyrin repeat domain-containing protein [Gammaproteobacteria bacterium]